MATTMDKNIEKGLGEVHAPAVDVAENGDGMRKDGNVELGVAQEQRELASVERVEAVYRYVSFASKRGMVFQIYWPRRFMEYRIISSARGLTQVLHLEKSTAASSLPFGFSTSSAPPSAQTSASRRP
jgi:hypothetical protein